MSGQDRPKPPGPDALAHARLAPVRLSTVLLSTSRTHLFRGARLVCAGEFPGCAAAARIRFGDGIEVDAELMQRGADEFALDVPAHRTAAGAEIAPKAWRIARIEAGGDGRSTTVLVVGDRLA